MKPSDFEAAMAMYADADQRSTANMVEMLAAAILHKLNPPARGDDVVSVTISPRDIEETIRTHHFEASYDGDEMTLFLTPLGYDRAVSAATDS